jgi:hypothetical protein
MSGRGPYSVENWLEIYAAHCHDHADQISRAVEESRLAQQGPRGALARLWPGRSTGNPVGGWYGLKKGLRGRFGMYVPPLMEALGLAEVEHNPRNNRMRAI